MGPSYMGPNFFKEIAKMSLELLGLLLELLLLLLLLLLHEFSRVLLRGREAPPLELRHKYMQQKQQQKRQQQQPQQLQGHFGNFFEKVQTHVAM